MRPAGVTACVLVLAFALAAPCVARPTDAPLGTRLARALDVAGVVPARTGALVIDLPSDDVVFARNPGKPLQPASNEKLATGLAALDELGGDYRIRTVVLGAGTRRGTRWEGDLVLLGGGDPDLGHGDLDVLARRLRASGIRRVSGRVVGDESYFDSRRTAPGWKPSFYKLECPPLSALVVDRAWLDGHTWDKPALAAAIAFKRALERTGIRVSKKAAIGTAPGSATELASVASPPLHRLIKVMETESDNFYAEQLLKLLGAEELGRGTTAAGAQVVRRELAQRDIPLAGVRIVDGSGLSRLDRVTARMLASLLVSTWNDPTLAKPFTSSLALAGVSGTLEERLTTPPARGRVRAKTGTTSVASALSGYSGTGYVFVLVMNGNPVDVDAARRAQDRVARLLAAQ